MLRRVSRGSKGETMDKQSERTIRQQVAGLLKSGRQEDIRFLKDLLQDHLDMLSRPMDDGLLRSCALYAVMAPACGDSEETEMAREIAALLPLASKAEKASFLTMLRKRLAGKRSH